jgi:hypothetical protein
LFGKKIRVWRLKKKENENCGDDPNTSFYPHIGAKKNTTLTSMVHGSDGGVQHMLDAWSMHACGYVQAMSSSPL